MKKPLLIVSYGVGRDSTALLVGLKARRIRPDLIMFADTGSERQATYDYLDYIRPILVSWGFPDVTVVRYECKDFKHWPPYHSLEENCLTNMALPSIAYGYHKCSSKWKIAPQERFLKTWQPAVEAIANGEKMVKAIGFDASPHEQRRSKGCSTYAIQTSELDHFVLWFPLQDWNWDLDMCIKMIELEGLRVPQKSSCFFCTAMKPWEVDELAATEPDKLRRIVMIERRAEDHHLTYAESKGWPNGVGKPMTAGLWRKAVKGMRGATPKPGSMTEYILQKGLMPAEEVHRIRQATPGSPITRDQFSTWQQFRDSILKEMS